MNKSRTVDTVVLDLSSDVTAETGEKSKSLTMNMPVGCYSDAQNITPTCGLCGEYSIIGEKDVAFSFFHPDRFCTYPDGIRINDITISDINFSDLPYISVKIGVAENATHVGGINIFGDKYGNYPQPLVLKVGYQIDK